MTELWLNAGKPTQQVHGVGEPNGGTVPVLDIVGCRVNTLLQTHRIPVFGPADQPEVFDPDAFALDHYDYLWVERAFMRSDAPLGPYHGPGLYSLFAAQYLLQSRVIALDDVKYGLRAGREIPTAELADAIEQLKEMVAEAAGKTPECTHAGDLEYLKKFAVLAWIGILNSTHRYKYKVRLGGIPADGRADVTMRYEDPRKPPAYRTDTRVIDSRSGFPIGLLALQREACWVDYAQRQLRSLGVRILGVQTDGVLFRGDRFAVEEKIVNVSHANGVRFKIKVEAAAKVHQNQQKRERRAAIRPRKLEWTTVEETDDAKIDALYKQGLLQDLVAETTGLGSDISGLIAEFVGHGWRAREPATRRKLLELTVRRGRALFTGPAGTGKTTLLLELLALWRELEPKANFVRCAFTHAAARLMGAGSTLAHVQNRHCYGPPRNTVYIIDEISQVPMSMLSRIGRGIHLGARFVLLGDYEGQFLPIVDGWSSTRPVQETEIVKDLAGCLHVKLTENRRFTEDPAHFERFKGLYGHADASPGTTRQKVLEMQHRYCWNRHRRVDIHLVLSHRKRRAVNHTINQQRDAAAGVFIPSVGGIKGMSSQPQAMYLRPGMSVLGCSGERKKIINGCEYVVTAVTDDSVVEDMLADFNDARERGVTLTHPEASRWLRLAYARCYYTSQGRTLRDAVVAMLDTGHRHFSVRHLIVGISRVPKGSDLMIPTPAQEAEFSATLTPIDDEPMNGEEVDEPEADDPEAYESDED
jgi:hypothetical protein